MLVSRMENIERLGCSSMEFLSSLERRGMEDVAVEDGNNKNKNNNNHHGDDDHHDDDEDDNDNQLIEPHAKRPTQSTSLPATPVSRGK